MALAFEKDFNKKNWYMLANLKEALYNDYVEQSCLETRLRNNNFKNTKKKGKDNTNNINTNGFPNTLGYIKLDKDRNFNYGAREANLQKVLPRIKIEYTEVCSDDEFRGNAISPTSTGYSTFSGSGLGLNNTDKMTQQQMDNLFPRNLEPLAPLHLMGGKNNLRNNRNLSLADTKQLKLFQRKHEFHNLFPKKPEFILRQDDEKTKDELSEIIQRRRSLRVMSLDPDRMASNMRASRLRTMKPKPTLFQQKEAAMLNLSLDSKMWHIKNTLEQMGEPPRVNSHDHITALPQHVTGHSNRRPSKVKHLNRTLSKGRSGEDLGIITEFSDADSNGLPSYRGGQMSDSDSTVEPGHNNPISKKNRQRRRRGKNIRKWKRLSHFLTIFFGLWKVHAAKVKYFLETNVDQIEIQAPVDLMFDVTEYKADKQACVSQETKRILTKLPEERTTDEVKHVQVALRNYQSIEEYPIKMTRRLAEKAWYEKFDSQRIIIQQWHPARCFYFILSGSVVVSKMDTEFDVSRTVCFLNRGESFGELGLINNAARQATVISKEPIELLVINDEEVNACVTIFCTTSLSPKLSDYPDLSQDYVEIFMGGGIKGTGDNFIDNLWCFEHWPVEILESHPTESFLSYFKRNTVLVHNSNISEWIYIIKSGSCTVIKKLHEVQPTVKQRTKKHDQKVKEVESTQDFESHHLELLEAGIAEADKKASKRSLHFRQKVLDELKLGIETLPIDNTLSSASRVSITSTITSEILVLEEESHDPVSVDTSEEDQIEDTTDSNHTESIDKEDTQESSKDMKHENVSNEDSTSNNANAESPRRQRKSVTIQDAYKGGPGRKMSLSGLSAGPFLKKTSILKSDSTDQLRDQQQQRSPRQSRHEMNATINLQTEVKDNPKQRKGSVHSKSKSVKSGGVGSPKRKISSVVSNASKSNTSIPKQIPTIVEEFKDVENSDKKIEIDDENTERIRREFDEIIHGDNKKKTKKTTKQDKKTISDELNIEYLKAQLGSADKPEDLHPTFVKVQTLTKGSIFGLADIVHYDQPSLSLVSNGAECIVIRKKLYLDHCDQKLLNIIRQQISPFPKNKHIQENLQTHVDWVDRKEKTMKEAMMWNRKKKTDIHNSRSLPSFEDLN